MRFGSWWLNRSRTAESILGLANYHASYTSLTNVRLGSRHRRSMKRTSSIAFALLLVTTTPALAEDHASPVVHKSNGGFVAGIVMTSLSGVFLAGGIGMVAAAAGMQNSFDGFGASLLVDAGAFAMFGGSLGFGISGIYLLAANAPSRS